MNFLGVILYPFTVLYDAGTRFRNYLFDIGYKRSFEFDTRVVSVGNLTVGGTGKTPMVEYLIRLLKDHYKLATLSRGYGRKSKGFKIASNEDDASTLGDEPYQFFNKHSDITVTVGEERAVAIPFILAERPETNLILLDDAYQHRPVQPNLNILLSNYHKPFYKDFLMPSGRLREARKGADRADIVVMTKCPENLKDESLKEIENQIGRYTNAPVFFSTINYGQLTPVYSKESIPSLNVILFSGLASADLFSKYVRRKYNVIEEVAYADHHDYTKNDIEKLIALREKHLDQSICFITTEKDMVKLLCKELRALFETYPVFFIPIEMQFVKDGKEFESLVLNKLG
ncbi:MAG: tetraacyldisaccharide 4'-kinase [Fulvivirga sp.]